jgi:hypothetical protein
MQQRITSAHLDQLTPLQKHNLRRWWNPQIGDWFLDPEGNERLYAWNDGLMRAKSDGMFDPAYDLDDPKILPLLSIGQMIALIQVERLPYSAWEGSSEDFLDALWVACKEVLARE